MIRRILAAIVRFLLDDPSRRAAREAEDIDMGIVPASRRYDRDLVRRMQRAAMFSAPDDATPEAVVAATPFEEEVQ